MKNSNNVKFGTLYGVDNRMIESGNTIATDYISENYEAICANVVKMGIDPTQAIDLVHTVYLAIEKKQRNGEGYDNNKGKRESCITVEQYVYGMMKGYSKNERFHKPSWTTSMEVAASTMATDSDDMSPVQRAYESAASFDEIELLEDKLSAREEVIYVLSFQSEITMNLRYMLLNLKRLAETKFDTSIMSEITNLVKSNADFAEAFANVVKFAGKNTGEFEAIMETV